MNTKEQLLNFSKNLHFLMQQHNINQKQLSQKTGTSTATINNYVNKKSLPSVKFLLALKKLFKVELDSLFDGLLTAPTTPTQDSSVTEKTEKYLGNYILYFYNSSEYKGRVSAYSKNTLKYGVLSLLADKTKSGITAIATFIDTRDDAEELKLKADQLSTTSQIKKLHSEMGMEYTGNIEVSTSQIFIYLKNKEQNDQVLIILNNPPSSKKYIGGLGTVNSISRGREHMPCVQFIIISRHILKIPDGEIYNLLALGVSDINVEKETEQLITLFKNLYVNADLKDDLSDFQKKKILENSLTSTFIELMDANVFRFAKISNMEDDDYYRIIIEEAR